MPDILKEYYQIVLTPQQLNEAMDTVSGGPMMIKKILLQKANTENRNRRIYPRNVLEREINKYNNDMVKTRRALGELDHTENMTVNLKNASHIITEMWWEGDEVYGNIEILDGEEFPAGRIAAGLLRRKIPVGISSRALGSVTEANGVSMVNDDLALGCFDLVSYESTIGSTLNLNEGAVLKSNKYDRFDQIIYDIICNNSGACACKFK
jgi:hypothetical protein